MPRRATPKRSTRQQTATPKRRTTTKRSRRSGTYGIDSLPRLAVAGATTMAIMGIGGAMANQFRG